MELSSSRMVAAFLREKTLQGEVEEFWVMALNPGCQLIEARMLFRGTVNFCFVHPRDVLRFGLIHNATFLVVGHNHPSESCVPSREDIELSKSLRQGGDLIQIPVIDHVIVTRKEHYSFARNWAGLVTENP